MCHNKLPTYIVNNITDDKRLKHLKVKLKSWEKEFQAKNGVQPTKVCYMSNLTAFCCVVNKVPCENNAVYNGCHSVMVTKQRHTSTS